METIHILSNSFQIFLSLSPNSLDWATGRSDLPEVAESHRTTRTLHQARLIFSTLLDWNKGSAEEWTDLFMWPQAQLSALTYKEAWVFIRSVGTAALHLPR